MCEMDRLFEGYKWAIDKIWGPRAKKRIFGRNPFFLPKKSSLFILAMFRPRPGKVLQTKQYPFSQINNSLSFFFFFWKKRIFGKKTLFGQT